MVGRTVRRARVRAYGPPRVTGLVAARLRKARAMALAAALANRPQAATRRDWSQQARSLTLALLRSGPLLVERSSAIALSSAAQ